jgi:predicted Zn-dependent peptidase
MSLLALSPQTASESGALPGGGTYILRRDAAAPTVAIELWYRAPGAGYDNAWPGISRLAITAVAASAPPHGTSLAELVTRVGGSLTINVYPDIAMVGVSVPSWQASSAIKALTSAYFTPSITDNGLKAAVRDSAIAAAESHFDSDRLLQDALFAHIFSAGPAHYPAIPPSAQDFGKIPSSDVKAFASRAFRRGNVFMTLTGSVDPKWLGNVPATQASGKNQDDPFDSTLSNANVDVTQNAQVSGIGFAWVGPPIADAKAATAMDFVADYLFDADHGTVAAAIRKNHSDAFVNGQFITLHNPGVLLVTLSGSDASKLRSAIIDAVNGMQQPLAASAFNAARTAFEYHILTQTQTPSSRADNYGWYAAEGNAPYAPGDESSEYFQAAQSLDPGYVAGIVRKYLQRPAVVQLQTSGHGTTT